MEAQDLPPCFSQPFLRTSPFFEPLQVMGSDGVARGIKLGRRGYPQKKPRRFKVRSATRTRPVSVWLGGEAPPGSDQNL